MTRIFTRPCWLLFALLLCEPALAAISAEVDRTRLNAGETVQLWIRVEGDRSLEPDLSPLDAHFEILSRSQSSQTRIINWKREEFREWSLVLAPKRAGIVVIPPIRAGDAATKPIALRVADAGSASSDKPADVFLETETSPKQVYVQSQLLLTVRVLHRYELEGNLTEPEIPGAQVEKLGDQRTYAELRNGIRYRITERRYAVFPQQSGTLKIPQLVLTGTLHKQSRSFGFNPFGPMQGGNSIRLRSDPVQVEVLPRPAGWPAAAPWLPAQDLRISTTWTPDTRSSRTGEPLVLQITTEADGLAANQLPAPAIRWPAGLQVYPDKAVLDNELDENGLTGTRVDRFTVIPSQPGRYRVPGVALPWWSMADNRRELARMPAVTLDIEAGAVLPAPDPAAPPSRTDSEAQPGSSAPGGSNAPGSPLPWLLALVLGLGWIGTAALWWRERNRRPGNAATADLTAQTPDQRWYQVARACRESDPRAAYQAILTWLRSLPPSHAAQVRHALSRGPAAAKHWERLERGLYRDGGLSDWDGQALFAVLNQQRKSFSAQSAASHSPLPPLYAET